jgi:hypothetical protein
MGSSVDSTGSSPQLQWIRNGLKAAESHVRWLRKADTWPIVAGTAASGRPAPDLARECEQVAAEYPDFLTT